MSWPIGGLSGFKNEREAGGVKGGKRTSAGAVTASNCAPTSVTSAAEHPEPATPGDAPKRKAVAQYRPRGGVAIEHESEKGCQRQHDRGNEESQDHGDHFGDPVRHKLTSAIVEHKTEQYRGYSKQQERLPYGHRFHRSKSPNI
jgi:hypothetical protein